MWLWECVFLLMLLVFLGWNAARLYCDIHATWYQSGYLLDTLYHVISILQYLSVPAFALLTRLRVCWNNFITEPSSFNVSRPFDMTFITSRVQVIRNASKRFQYSLRLPILGFFLLVPICVSCYNIYSDAKIFKNCTVTDKKHSSLQYFSSIMTILFYLHYGCFWYLVYIQRVSLHCQLNQAIKQIRGAAKNNDRQKKEKRRKKKKKKRSQNCLRQKTDR